MERITKQSTAILNAIQAAQRPLLAPEILEAAALEVPGMGMATVYRNIKSLVDNGMLTTVYLPGEIRATSLHTTTITTISTAPVATKCLTYTIALGTCNSWLPKGFTVESHEITLYGVCETCKLNPLPPSA
jgi:Fur family transcriptional regulator, ferric uptake regulator